MIKIFLSNIYKNFIDTELVYSHSLHTSRDIKKEPLYKNSIISTIHTSGSLMMP